MSERESTLRHGEAPRRSGAPTRGRVLFAEDDPLLLDAWARVLTREGFEVVRVCDGLAARALVVDQDFDVVVSDVCLPSLDGLSLLRATRSHDPDLPVIFITGHPDLETAVRAMEYGAMRYLTKPFEQRVLVDAILQGLRSRQLARTRKDSGVTVIRAAGKVSSFNTPFELDDAFEKALVNVHLAFQPIVSWSANRVIAYEALMRSRLPVLPTPPAMLEAAEKLSRLPDLGRKVRSLAAAAIDQMPANTRMFVNLHPSDLDDEHLYDLASPLTRHADRVTIEVTERAQLHDEGAARANLARLRALGFHVAVDDLGAGYAGLTSLALLHPQVVKIDMSLVRGVDTNPVTARIIRSVVQLCDEMKIAMVAEGVETAAERDTLLDLGCDLLQGYFFARPAPQFTLPAPGSMRLPV